MCVSVCDLEFFAISLRRFVTQFLLYQVLEQYQQQQQQQQQKQRKEKKTYIAKIIINGILGFFLMQYNLKKKLVILENYAIYVYKYI